MEFGNAMLLDDPDLKYGEKHPDESRGHLYKDISKVERSAVVCHKIGNLQFLVSYIVKNVRLDDWESRLWVSYDDCVGGLAVRECRSCCVVYGRRRIAVQMVKSARNLAREDVLYVAASLNY